MFPKQLSIICIILIHSTHSIIQSMSCVKSSTGGNNDVKLWYVSHKTVSYNFRILGIWHMEYFYETFLSFLKLEISSPHSLKLRGKGQRVHKSKFLLLCSTEKRKSYRFCNNMLVITNSRIFISG